jgi:hypothetical protein
MGISLGIDARIKETRLGECALPDPLPRVCVLPSDVEEAILIARSGAIHHQARRTGMGDKGSKDKGKKKQQKAAQQTAKEKRKQEKQKKASRQPSAAASRSMV